MSNLFKYGLIVSGAAIIIVFGFIVFGFYLMEIEDHYGDIQELYYKSKSGDIIINKTTDTFGIIEKNWKRINVRTQEKDSTDLYDWVYQHNTKTKVEIYRANISSTEFNKITYSELNKRIENVEFKLITKY